MKHYIATSLLSFLFLFTVKAYSQTEKLKKVEIRYPGGQIKVEGTTLKGKKHGASKTYYKNGNIESRNNWNKDTQIGKTEKWFENGYKNLEGQVQDSKQDGEWKYFDNLDGRYIYSVFYKNGKLTGYKFSEEKYRWRKLDLNALNFTIEIPIYLKDSMHNESYSGYKTMYPWLNKNDIEYYYIIKANLPTNEYALKKGVDGLTKGDLSLLSFIALEIERIPNVKDDIFRITQNREITIKGRKAFEIMIIFTEYNVEFKALIIPFKNSSQVVLAYFNQEVSQEIRNKYFNSIEFK